MKRLVLEVKMHYVIEAKVIHYDLTYVTNLYK